MLPPVPDQNGHPRPPAAPWVTGPWRGKFAVTAHSRTGHWRTVLGSTLDGPVLESAYARRPDGRAHETRGALAYFTFVGIVLSVYSLLAGGAVFVPLGLAVLAVWVELVAATGSAVQRLEATAYAVEEFTQSDGPGPQVQLHELTRIRLVTTPRSGPALLMADRRHGRLCAPCGLLEGNPYLWALVYNGIRHSTTRGARVDDMTRYWLRLY